MNNMKKKIIRVFSNGSMITHYTFLKQQNKTQISNKDHSTFICYQKDKSQTINSTSVLDLKRKNYFL